MKNVKRVVSTGIWDDDLVLEQFSPEDKYFMLYLLTNRYTSQLGIYHLPLVQVSRDLGYTQDAVNVLLDRFEHKYDLIKYSKDTKEIAIKNYLRHSILKGGKPVMDCLVKEEKQIKDKSLIVYVVKHMANYLDDDTTIPTIKEYISNYIKENNIDINNNDNERIVDVTLTLRQSLEQQEKDFALIYALYPKKTGKAKAFTRYQKWISKTGYKVNGRYIHLTNKQIWMAVKKYVDLKQANDTDLQFYKGFDVLMGQDLLDYVEEE